MSQIYMFMAVEIDVRGCCCFCWVNWYVLKSMVFVVLPSGAAVPCCHDDCRVSPVCPVVGRFEDSLSVAPMFAL